ncbi:MAG: pilin [bacterium]
MKLTRKHFVSIGLLAVFFVFFTPVFDCLAEVSKAKPPIELSISIGGKKTVADLPAYLGLLYKWFVGAAMVIAAFMITLGGFQYVMAGGVPSMADQGKKRIKNSLIGLVLAIGSYVLLNTINPAYTVLKLPDIQKIENVNLNNGGTCPDTDKNKGKYKCGDPLYKDTPQKGIACRGVWCPKASDQCAPYQETKLVGGSTVKETKYKCLNAASCPGTCSGIKGAFGPGWEAVCMSTLCRTQIKDMCYTLYTGGSGTIAVGCVPRKSKGEPCSDENPVVVCKPGLSCEGDVCVQLDHTLQAYDECDDDKQCKSSICNRAAVPVNKAGQITGLCAPVGGYKLPGAPCEFNLDLIPGRAGMCGASWACVVPFLPRKDAQGVLFGACSDRFEKSDCDYQPLPSGETMPPEFRARKCNNGLVCGTHAMISSKYPRDNEWKCTAPDKVVKPPAPKGKGYGVPCKTNEECISKKCSTVDSDKEKKGTCTEAPDIPPGGTP